MDPRIELTSSKNKDVLMFTLGGVNVSLANAIRRTILSDIQTVVFKTTPYEENMAEIKVNTTRINNEILKQRLSCIPIIMSVDTPLENLIMELNVENLTNTTIVVTTEDFKIRDLSTGELFSEAKTREIFPPDEYTGYFIDFVRLRPRISDELKGEAIQLTCKFKIGTAKEDAMFNAVSTCSYGCSVDEVAMEKELQKQVQTWKDDGKTKEQIDFESKNWKLLDGQRIVKKDHFDFTIQTIGQYTNEELVNIACTILIEKLNVVDVAIDTDELEIVPSETTMTNSFDITLVNEDYTIGKAIEYGLYTNFYENAATMTFCGFKKFHPHDSNSFIRISYKNETEKVTVKQNLKVVIAQLIKVFEKIRDNF
jgi:DNA-directed RNA polymerase alpha subunit